MGVAALVIGLLNWLYLIKESMEQTDFLTGDTFSGWPTIFGSWAWLKLVKPL